MTPRPPHHFARLPLGEERGSLPMALLVTIVGSALAALLIATVITQYSTTRFDTRRSDSLQIAAAGLDVALGQIRAAGTWDEDSGRLIGDVTRLPCGPLTGEPSDGGTGTFSVSIGYFTVDPSSRDAEWRTSNAMACSPGHVLYKYDEETGTDIYVPSYVLLTSTGTSSPNQASRTLEATYPVFTSIWNSFGGAFVTGDGTSRLCVDGGALPKAGDRVTLQECLGDSTPAPSQSWAFLQNLTIQLTSTVGNLSLNSDGTGLCLLSPAQTTNGFNRVTLTECAPTNSAGIPQNPTKAHMQWGVDDSGHFVEARTSGFTNFCMDNGAPSSGLNRGKVTSGTELTVASCDGSVDSPSQIFIAKYGFGAGQSGETTGQLVNFGATSRCLDVTSQKVDSEFLILYTCKQTLTSGGVTWNQRWLPKPAGGGLVQLVTRPSSGTDYCLTSPGTLGGYVRTIVCDSGNQSQRNRQKWQYYQDVDTNGDPLPLKTMYTIVDSQGHCLDFNDELYGGSASPKVVVSVCNGLATQKWNANPDPLSSKLTNLREVTGSTEP